MSDKATPSFPPISIDDLITHDQVLEQYAFISAQILNRWLREGSIRCFRGKDGKQVYAKVDLSVAIDKEMTLATGEPATKVASGPQDNPGRPEMSEADALRERLYWRRRQNSRKGTKITSEATIPEEVSTETGKRPVAVDIRLADRLIGLREVKEITNFGSSTIYKRMNNGSFPQSQKPGPGCVRWLESEIEKWIAKLPTM